MKRNYVKPVFVAECYSFSSSIAKCGWSVNDPLTVNKGDNLCKGGNDGHVYKGQNGKKGLLQDAPDTITLFNDGSASACQYDWNGETNIVSQTGADFASSFYGNEADWGSHAPGYKGLVFYS